MRLQGRGKRERESEASLVHQTFHKNAMSLEEDGDSL